MHILTYMLYNFKKLLRVSIVTTVTVQFATVLFLFKKNIGL